MTPAHRAALIARFCEGARELALGGGYAGDADAQLLNRAADALEVKG